jgi:hypothetical protein
MLVTDGKKDNYVAVYSRGMPYFCHSRYIGYNFDPKLRGRLRLFHFDFGVALCC